MSFTPKRILVRKDARSQKLDVWQRRAVLGMVGMVLLSFLASNLWAVFWQQSEWLVATILPAVVVDLTNEERESAAAGVLTRNSTLDAAAQLKAEHMAAEGYFAHHSPTGVTPWHWFETAGYEYAHAGENLAVHFTDSTSLVAAWMNSPTHRENIVNQQFTEIGVGTARGEFQGYPTVFVVQLFGTPAATPTPTATIVPEESSEPVPVTEAAVASTTLARDEDEAVASTSDTIRTVAERVAGQQADLDDRNGVQEPPAVATTTPTEVATPTPEAGSWQVTGVYSTSSGAPAATAWGSENQAGTSVAALATQPHRLLQWFYGGLSLAVLVMVLLALRLEFRRHQYVQMAYSLMLLLLMGGLWYLHGHLISGAVVV